MLPRGKLQRLLAAPLPAALVLVSSVALAVGYRVPHTTAYIENCRRAAAGPYPGEVRLVSSNITDSAARIKLHIEQEGGHELVVVCDGPTGKIMRVYHIDER